jgi:type II secretory pathway pseudopilin PulG
MKENLINKVKKEKGITLIALVVTIVVLLILAGISINLVLSQNGLVTKAKDARDKASQAETNDYASLNDAESSIDSLVQGAGGTPTTYKEYAVGDYVKIGTEGFYVIKASSSTEEYVTLLAAKCINTSTLTQTDNYNTIAFSKTNYWSEATTYPLDLNTNYTSSITENEAYALYYAKCYAESVVGDYDAGRLMKVEEVVALDGNMYTFDSSECPEWINTSSYWLSSTSYDAFVWDVVGDIGCLYDNGFNIDDNFGVRPVIEISKSLIS